MNIKPIKIGVLVPPKDDLVHKIIASSLKPKDGDIIAVTSKVVSINEGRCVRVGSIKKEALARRESSLYLNEKPKWGSSFTITKGVLIRAAGIDESNGNGHYILWPHNPQRSAALLRKKLMQEYKLSRLGVIITDSISTPLRRGAIGFALAWTGFEPLSDYRGIKDVFGRPLQYEQANVADALAAAAVVIMGEGGEQTPLVVIRGVAEKIWHKRKSKGKWNKFVVPLKEDLFAQFLTKTKWKKGGKQ
ncbi:MAG: coenzyme F420-0:L-glutamate ligase [Minisyncoccia bacterium]